MKPKITLLFLLFVILCVSTSCQTEVLGKYYNIEDDKALHYVDFKADGTFFHYYKKDTIERSHSGEWTREDNKIHIFNWEEYSYEYLKIISGMGKVEFGTILGNQIFWIRGPFLNNTPDGSSPGSYIKEEDVEKVRSDSKEEEERWQKYLKDKDTFYFPNTKIIKAIGIEEIISGKNEKNYGWKHFYNTGELESEGKYSSNWKKGIWKYYYKNGKLKEIGAYEDSLKVGMWKHYHDNGKLKEKGIYIYKKNGVSGIASKNSSSKYYLTQKRGIWEYYDTDGKLKNTKIFATREKFYDSIFVSMGYSKEYAIDMRKETINREDKYYSDYNKASLTTKK
ncbi:toxin-antitoxin system YwqK family antitoxin [Flavobacterium sp. 140616W15]|uniref:toxin-antitoxin system YwqK family antitoxin n=1 Tax=Flavobacterium sp. 140616W15 TaxID=2478552 RepID=UPI000F0BFFD0|nr:hypothetical protein [Flavobacterium sp. 140616W15]AYN05784.1 hypothetical protein EAG11_17720 [Flavobacterium sp. 140616W15]